MVRKGESMGARKHEQASQAAFCHQSTGLGELALEPCCEERVWSGNTKSMSLSGLLKGRGLIGLLRFPDGVQDACPNIGQSTDGDGMALALGPLALVILLRPGLLVCTLPGKLLQGITPGLDATQPAMRFLVGPALEEDRRGASESLQAACARVSVPIITEFSEHARSETFPGSRQRLEKLVVLMHHKKAFDLLIIVSNLLEQRLQLVDQCQHQPRFGACRDRVGLQTRLLELCRHLLGSLLGSRISGLFEQS